MELRFPEKHGTIIRYRNASAKLEADSVKMTITIPVDGWDETRVRRESSSSKTCCTRKGR